MTRITRKCPKCGSTGLLTERRPNGDSACYQCGHKGPTSDFDKAESPPVPSASEGVYRKSLEQIWELPVASAKDHGNALATCKKLAHDALMVGNILTKPQGEVTLSAVPVSEDSNAEAKLGLVRRMASGEVMTCLAPAERAAIKTALERIAELEAQLAGKVIPANYSFDLSKLPHTCGKDERLREFEHEIRRLRRALTEILFANGSPNDADFITTTAREALADQTDKSAKP